MKNILIIDTGKEWGGGTNSLFELLKRMPRENYNLTALFYENCKRGYESDIDSELRKIGIDLILLTQRKQPIVAKILKELLRVLFLFSRRLKKHFIFRIDLYFRIKPNALRIARILNDLRIDLLYMNNQPSSNLEGILASKMAGIPALQHSRIETELNSFEVKIANLWLKKIICVSEGVKESLVNQGIDSAKCVTVHNGIDPGTTPSIPPAEIRKRWEISDSNFLVGTVGSLIKRKRIKDLIDAIAIVANMTKHPIKCMIIGEGPEKNNLLAEVKRKNLTNIIFTGFQHDAISYINALDIFVLPSEKEGLPRVILESMLMAKPVVASNVTGPAELVVDGETGFLVPVRHPEIFADRVLKLIENHELRGQMGEKARRRVVENFSIEKYVAGVENVFEGVW